MTISTDYAVAYSAMPAFPAFAAFRADMSIPTNAGHKLATRSWETPPPRARMPV
jgi:hypothetical protein